MVASFSKLVSDLAHNLGLKLIVGLFTCSVASVSAQAAEVEARFALSDTVMEVVLRDVLEGIRIPTSKSGGIDEDDNFVRILSIKDVSFDGNTRVSLAARYETRFLFRFKFTVKDLQVAISQHIEDRNNERMLIVTPNISYIDISGLPGGIERRIMRRANSYLSPFEFDVTGFSGPRLKHPSNPSVYITPDLNKLDITTEDRLAVVLSQKAE